MPSQQLDEKAIFNVARAIESPEARAEYLRQACGDDSVLAERVTKLLAGFEDPNSFLDPPSGALPTLNMPPVEEGPGSEIGSYKLREQIGEGGMGVVYVAEQEEPVRRKVALKIIKPGMDTKEVIARFEAERQALALMDHSNIAKVLDAGSTESGRPYFVMELVRGVPVTEYCDKNKLATKPRLRLFITVCQAVQHAHLKGIIHRDIKPSNVLITLHDGTPVPKVIDFGVAKATNQKLTERTVYTQFSQMIGTPLYMSPEQAEMSGLDVDTRSDVYSLGVLLYELLTGTTPFDKETLTKAGYDEMRRIIREDDPPVPSERVSTLGATLSTIAQQRSVEPRRLSNQLRGELDWVVMRALEKDRTRRYESASALAADIERYLDDEPVEACPPSTVYRLKKFVRRHKAVLTSATLVAMALMVGTGISVWKYFDEREARREADTQRVLAQQAATKAEAQRKRAGEAEQRARKETERAKTEAAITRAINEFINDDLLAAGEEDHDADPNLQLRTVVDRASAKIEGQFDDQPLVEAAIRNTIARIYHSLGKYRESEIHHERAANIRRDTLGQEHPDTLASLHSLADIYRHLGQYAKAGELIQQVLESKRRVLGPEHEDTLKSMNQLALVHLARKDFNRARELLEQLVALSRRVNGPEHRSTLIAMSNLAMRSLLDTRESERRLATLLPTARRALGPQDRLTITIMMNLGSNFQVQGRLEEAEAIYEQSLELRQQVLGQEHPETLKAMIALGSLRTSQQRYAEARETLEWALERQLLILPPDHPSTLRTLIYLGQAFSFEAWNLATREGADRRDGARAVELATKGVEIYPDEANNWDNLGVAHWRAGNWQDAVQALEKAKEMRGGRDLGHQIFLAMAHWQLAQREDLSAEDRHGHQTEAQRNYDEVALWMARNQWTQSGYRQRFREEAEQLMGPPSEWVRLAADATAHVQAKQWEQAIADWGQAIAAKPDDPELWLERGRAFRNLRQLDRAVSDFTKVLELKNDELDAYNQRSAAYHQLGEFDKSIVDCSAAIKLDSTRAWPYHRRAGAHNNLGEYDKALADSNEAIRLNPKDPWGYSVRAEAYSRKKQWERAIADCSKALELNAKVGWFHLQRAASYIASSKWTSAVADLEAHTELTPEQVLAWWRLAMAHLGNDDLQQYRALCAQMLQHFRETDNAFDAFVVAWTCAVHPESVDDWDESLRLAELAVVQEPENADYLNTLGGILYRVGRYEEAIQRLEAAEPGINQSLPERNWYFLAMAHQQLGQRDEARKWMNMAAEWERDYSDDASIPWDRRVTNKLHKKEATALLAAGDEET